MQPTHPLPKGPWGIGDGFEAECNERLKAPSKATGAARSEGIGGVC